MSRKKLHISKNICYRIKIIRNYSGLNQKIISEKCNSSASYWCEIEKGKTIPSLEILGGLIRLFPEINIKWLFFGEGDMLHKQIDSLTEDVFKTINQRLEEIEDKLKILEEKLS